MILVCIDGLSWAVNERFSMARPQSAPGCKLEAPVVSCLVIAGIQEQTGTQGSDVGNLILKIDRGQEHAGSVNSVR